MDRLIVFHAMELGEARYPHPFHPVHRAVFGIHFARNQPKDGGFARPIPADEANMFTFFHAKVDVC